MSRDDREKEILRAALGLFARFGYRKTAVEDVARETGMTKGNVYFYVRDKRDLYEKAVGNALIEWRDSVAAAVECETGAVKRFRVMARRSFEYLSGRPDLRKILEEDRGIFTLSAGEDRFREINEGAMGILRSILEQGIREKTFRRIDVPHTTELIFSIYIMFLIKAYVKSEGSSVLKMFEEGLDIILRGLLRK
ncbi:MAG: TetR/AcrR family transcriptional regulator [Spirochaetes bacterium]|nr:MAG: TetR/AcrR family transcriptional regulator [Spirochaetota bacterium]